MSRSVLVIGYGNPGRLDDGLGPAFAAAVEAYGFPGVTVESDYQLTVEDAAEIAPYDVVFFADASVSCKDPFELAEVRAEDASHLSFSSHSVKPEGVLALSYELFERRGKAYVLSIRGHEFDDFGERLSEQAKVNLAAAVEFFVSWLKDLEKPVEHG